MKRASVPTLRAIAFDGVGKENAGAHQTQNCCNPIDHRKRFIVPTWASVFCLTNSGRCLATGQLHVSVVAFDVGVIGDNQSLGIAVSALDAHQRTQSRWQFACRHSARLTGNAISVRIGSSLLWMLDIYPRSIEQLIGIVLAATRIAAVGT